MTQSNATYTGEPGSPPSTSPAVLTTLQSSLWDGHNVIDGLIRWHQCETLHTKSSPVRLDQHLVHHTGSRKQVLELRLPHCWHNIHQFKNKTSQRQYNITLGSHGNNHHKQEVMQLLLNATLMLQLPYLTSCTIWFVQMTTLSNSFYFWSLVEATTTTESYSAQALKLKVPLPNR